ncbi:hypothetical protein QAD02_005840 [Eretmocerus hayati]|uniref:Uncharacterized protein n=1 Tax=Eretmocerus hayati TaxID=131215 RepID=A0ACC2NUN5_9HYME|nr:hypothetical protein QAD02_005840 [Eretmocerus hayati]
MRGSRPRNLSKNPKVYSQDPTRENPDPLPQTPNYDDDLNLDPSWDLKLAPSKLSTASRPPSRSDICGLAMYKRKIALNNLPSALSSTSLSQVFEVLPALTRRNDRSAGLDQHSTVAPNQLTSAVCSQLLQLALAKAALKASEPRARSKLPRQRGN